MSSHSLWALHIHAYLQEERMKQKKEENDHNIHAFAIHTRKNGVVSALSTATSSHTHKKVPKLQTIHAYSHSYKKE